MNRVTFEVWVHAKSNFDVQRPSGSSVSRAKEINKEYIKICWISIQFNPHDLVFRSSLKNPVERFRLYCLER